MALSAAGGKILNGCGCSAGGSSASTELGGVGAYGLTDSDRNLVLETARSSELSKLSRPLGVATFASI